MSSDLEKDFDTIVEEVNAKIKEAAKVLQAMNRLVKEAGYKTTYRNYNLSWEDYDVDSDNEKDVEDHENFVDSVDFNPLFSELQQAGWSTSAMKC